MKSYYLSPSGRRTSVMLLIGALVAWAFAIYALRSTLGTIPGEENIGFLEALRRNVQAGLGVSQIVPALLMIGLIVATPLVFWNILEEYAARYTPSEDGLRYESIGVALTYPWEAMTAIRRGADDEASDSIALNRDFSGAIRNPLVRMLHAQAFGRMSVLIPAGIEQRAELLAEISAQTGLPLQHVTDEAPVV